jgi:hypothetical protein
MADLDKRVDVIETACEKLVMEWTQYKQTMEARLVCLENAAARIPILERANQALQNKVALLEHTTNAPEDLYSYQMHNRLDDDNPHELNYE